MADNNENPNAGTSFNVFEEEFNGKFTGETEGGAPNGDTQTQSPQVPAVQSTPAGNQPPNQGANPATVVPPVSQQTQAPTQVPGAVALTPDQLKELVQSLNPQQTQQQQQVQETQLTPEQIDEKFAVFRPNQEQLDSLFKGGPEAVATMQNMLHATAKMGATIAAHHLLGEMQKLRQELSSQFAPIRQESEQRQVQEHTQKFYTQFPHLKPYEPVLVSVYNSLLASGFKGTPEQVYAKIAEESERLIRAVNPAFVPPVAGQPPVQGGTQQPPAGQTQAPARSQMTPLAMGGGSGGANPQSSSGTKTTAEAIFG